MATDYQNIIVSLRAKVGDFRKKMASAGRAMKRNIVGGARAAGRAVSMAGTAIAAAGAAAAAGIAYMTVRVSANMDATGKLADRLGATTESLIGLRHAATLAGVSAGTLDKSLEKFNKRLGDAVAGGGPAAKVLEQFGLSAADLIRLPMADRMAIIADAFAKIPSQAQRAAAAQQLFGKSGLAMVTMLQGGSAGVKAAMAEAGELGLTYSREQAAAAEKFQDTLARLKAVLMGVGQTVATALLPYFDAFAGRLLEFGKQHLPTFAAIFANVFSAVLEVGQVFGEVFRVVFDSVGAVLAAFGVSFSGVGGGVEAILNGIVSVVRFVAKGWVLAFTLIETVAVNWRAALDLVIKGLQLGIVKLAMAVKHWFTVAMPAWLGWLKNHWWEVFKGIGEGLKNSMFAIWENMKVAWAKIKGVFTGDDAKEDWVSIGDAFASGFEKHVKALPEIAKRAKSDIEKELEADIGKASSTVGNYYKDKVTERLKGLEDTAAKTGSKIKDTAAEAADASAQAAKDAFGGLYDAAGAAGGQVKAAASAPSRDHQSDFGVLARRVSLTGLAMSRGNDKDAVIAKNTGETAEAVKQLSRAAMTAGVLVFTNA